VSGESLVLPLGSWRERRLSVVSSREPVASALIAPGNVFAFLPYRPYSLGASSSQLGRGGCYHAHFVVLYY
jgi:hypothetical protein